MDKQVQFLIFDTGSESNIINMSDVQKMPNATQITETHKHVNKLVDFLIRVHFSYKLNTICNLPAKSFWKKYCVLEELVKDDNAEYYIVIINNAIHRFSVKYLNRLREKKNVHLVSLLLDAYEKLPSQVCKMIEQTNFETIYSFQMSDCTKYGFKFTNQIYSKVNIEEYMSDCQASDVYFVGAEKGRIEEIYEIYSYLTSRGIKCDFTVIVSKRNLSEFKRKYKGIEFKNSRIGYKEILGKISKTKCILELCQRGQDGLTMRFYEALFYNKLLITNNATAKNHVFYDSRYMQVISKIEDINVADIQNVVEINYNYGNELSPIHFLKSLL